MIFMKIELNLVIFKMYFFVFKWLKKKFINFVFNRMSLIGSYIFLVFIFTLLGNVSKWIKAVSSW